MNRVTNFLAVLGVLMLLLPFVVLVWILGALMVAASPIMLYVFMYFAIAGVFIGSEKIVAYFKAREKYDGSEKETVNAERS